MAATFMTVEFGTLHHYYIQEEIPEACLCSPFDRYRNQLNYVNCVILVQNNHVKIFRSSKGWFRKYKLAVDYLNSKIKC